MAHDARIEELSDSSDPDPPEDDVEDFAPALIRPSDIPTPNSQQPPSQQSPPEYKHYQCIYPLYFDTARSRAEGRRVNKELAVENPLAREIVDAVQLLGLKTVFEPGKMHPKDWANPGRVRVLVKEGGRARSGKVKNSESYTLCAQGGCMMGWGADWRVEHHLYTLISAHLKAHPTTAESPLRLRIQGMPPPNGPVPPPAVPRGWKMGTVLPLHSPALSGGGVSENMLKDVMQEMQGAGQGRGTGGMAQMLQGMGGGGGAVDGPAAGGKRRREKEGKKK